MTELTGKGPAGTGLSMPKLGAAMTEGAGPLAGVRVLEVASHVFVPMAAAVL